MNSTLRKIASSSNEVITLLGVLLSIGYFGIRGLGGVLPAVSLMLILGISIGGYFWYQAQTPRDDRPERAEGSLPSWAVFIGCMFVGMALVTFIGSKL